MAVDETTDDTKGVNDMWYVILSLVTGGAFTAAFSVVMIKDIRAAVKRGYRPDGEDIMMCVLCTYSAISLFALAIYLLI